MLKSAGISNLLWNFVFTKLRFLSMYHISLNKYIFSLLILFPGVFISCKPKAITPVTETKCAGEVILRHVDLERVKKEINYDLKHFQVDMVIQKKVHHEGFNGAVLVAQKGVVIYDSVFGYADMRTHTPLTSHSAFQLASVSKTITATAVLRLVEAGKLSLNDSIQKFFPKFPYHHIYVRDLLSHRSGLPNYLYGYDVNRSRRVARPSNRDIIEWYDTISPTPPPYRMPGSRFGYCNTNFALLASIIEKVSGKSFPCHLRETIFNPLGMNDTFVDTIGSPEQLSHKTVSHKGRHVCPRDYFDGVYGDKGIYSTTHDLFRFYTALVNNCIISKHTFANALKPLSLESRSRHNYGMGFRLMTSAEDMNHVKYVYHNGWWQGYCTVFWFNPKDDWVIIMLENHKNNTVYAVHPIIEILTGKPFGDDAEAVDE